MPRLVWSRPWPWVSLVLGALSATLMDRRPERAWLVVGAIALAWTGIIATLVARRIDGAPLSAISARRVALARALARMAALNPIQFALFFTLPFYYRAYVGTPGQAVFLALLGTAASVTLWEPLEKRVASHPVGSALLQSLASFAACNAMLPLFGLANRTSLILAVIATMIAVPLAAVWSAPALSTWRRRVPVLALALVWPLVMALPAGRRAVPAAPLRLVEGAIGTALDAYDLLDGAERLGAAPTQLVCYTTLSAPRGLRDAVVHVWRKDGAELDRIAVTVRGGREAGFRTWSIKQNIRPRPAGLWSCSVETASGQLLGERVVVVGDPGLTTGANAP